MQRFMMYCLSMGLSVIFVAATCSVACCEARAARVEHENAATVKVKLVKDGLVVIVNTDQQKSEEVHFTCNQETNEIVIDVPADSDESILSSLQNNPNVKSNGVSSVALPRQGIKRIKIVPRLKLYCDDMKMVNRFQRYATCLYPVGRDLKLVAAYVQGLEFDENRPGVQVVGSLRLTFNEPLGDLDLSAAFIAVDRTLSVRLNPRDVVNAELLSSILPIRNLDISRTIAERSGVQSFTFENINGAVINKVAAKVIMSPASSEARIDLNLTVDLYETGRLFYEKGNSQKALQYMAAVKNDPAFALISRMSAGTILWNEDNHAEAYKSFWELTGLDKSWEFPDARYFAAKTYYLANKRLNFELSALLKTYLRRCERMKYATCRDASDLAEQVDEPGLKLNQASRIEVKKLAARLADPTLNYNEVQKNIFHYWATWCPVCLEEMPRIMQYAVAHPSVTIYIVAKYDSQKAILDTLLKAGAIRRKNIIYYIDTKDDMILRQMVPAILAGKEPVTPLPISVFLQRDNPFYLTDKLDWTEKELSRIWQLKYRE